MLGERIEEFSRRLDLLETNEFYRHSDTSTVSFLIDLVHYYEKRARATFKQKDSAFKAWVGKAERILTAIEIIRETSSELSEEKERQSA